MDKGGDKIGNVTQSQEVALRDRTESSMGSTQTKEPGKKAVREDGDVCEAEDAGDEVNVVEKPRENADPGNIEGINTERVEEIPSSSSNGTQNETEKEDIGESAMEVEVVNENKDGTSTPSMTTRSGRHVGKSIRKTLFKSTQRRCLTVSASKRRQSVPGVGRKRKLSGGSPLLPSKKQIQVNTDDLFNNIETMLRESEERQTKLMMAAVEKKLDEGLKEIKKTVTNLKKEQKDFIKEQRDKVAKIEENLVGSDKAFKRLDKEMKQLTSKVQTSKVEMEKSLESKKRYIEAEIVDTKDILKRSQETAKESRTKIHERIDHCVGRVSSLEDNMNELSDKLDPDGDLLHVREFPVKCTAVAKFVKQPDGVSPTKLGKVIINEALELENIKVIRAISMSRNDENIGTLKIQLESPEDLQTVLQSKYRLNEYDDDPDMKGIRLRQSKTHEQLVAEQNADAMLKALDLYGDFYRTDKGFLLPKDQQKKNSRGPRQGNSRGRGRGRGRGNMRGKGPRGTNRSGRDSESVNGEQAEATNDFANPPRRRLSESTKRLLRGVETRGTHQRQNFNRNTSYNSN